MTLTIRDTNVVYERDGKIMWTLDIDKIKFIGEYTTSAGPFADDWFFVFADKVDEWWQAPMLSVEHNLFWKQLGQKLNCELAPKLFASTSWMTRVMYPRSLYGQELFKIVKVETKPKTFWRNLFGAVEEDERIELTDNLKRLFS